MNFNIFGSYQIINDVIVHNKENIILTNYKLFYKSEIIEIHISIFDKSSN